MTVSSSTARADYNGNSVTVDFAVPFRFLLDTDLQVLRTQAGVSTTLTLNSLGADGYFVTGAGQPSGGNVRTVSAPTGAPLQKITILRSVDRTQLTDYIPNDAFPAESHERALDKLTMIVQEQDEILTRALTLPAGLPGLSVSLPVPESLEGLRWNASATGLENFVISPFSAPSGAANVGFQPPDVLSTAMTVAEGLSNGVSVAWYATTAQLAIDATAATQAAIAYAYLSGRNAVYFPGGKTYRFAAASASIDPGVGPIAFYGDGPSSLLIFEEGTSTDANVENRKNLFKSISIVAKGAIEFRNLWLQGTWSQAGYPSGQGGAPFMLYNYDEVVITGCRVTNMRSYVMVNEFCKNARVIGNTFDKNARDNCRFRSTFNVQVIGNRFSHCDDDAVALHCNITVTGGDIREGLLIADNLFEDCAGIQIIGGRMVNVRGNILRRCKQNGILIYTAPGVASEGDNSIFNIAVTDNHIFDMLNDSPFVAAVSQCIGVYARSAEGGSSTGGIIPGQNNVATGVFPLPWNSRNGAYTGAVDSVPPPFFVRVQNNIIARTLPAVATYSVWGYGSCYAGDGPQNPAVIDTSLRPGTGILLGGQVRKAIVSGNVVSHVGTCIGFDAEAGSNFGLDDILVSNNSLSDFNAAAVNIPNPGAARHINLDIRHNLMDGDPYHISANRGTLGTWLADTVPSVINCTSHQGVRLEQNKIRNVARVVNNGGGGLIALKDNVLRCDPSVTGFSTANKGIGNPPRADDAFRYEIVDSDPTSATYGNLTSAILPFAGSIPTTGKYVAGTFVRAASGTALFGWQRLTTGTAHTAGVDWKTVVLT